MFRPRYFFWDSTPLKFYKFLKYFALPVGILNGSLQIVNYIMQGSDYWIDIAALSLIACLLLAAEVGLCDRKWYGVICLYAGYGSIALYALIVGFVNYYYLGEVPSQQMSTFFGDGILLFLISIYFSKRRPLFSPIPAKFSVQPTVSQSDNCVVSSSDNEFKSDPAERIDSVPSSASAITPAVTDTIQDTQRISRSSSPRHTVAIICLAFVSAVLSIALGITLHELSSAKSNVAELETSLDSLENRIKLVTKSRDEYQSKYNELFAENLRMKMSYEDLEDNYYRFYYDLSWYYNRIGFIVEGSSYYHSYDCSIFQEADTYWAHNIEYCKYHGYSRCPYCFSDDMLSD